MAGSGSGWGRRGMSVLELLMVVSITSILVLIMLATVREVFGGLFGGGE